MKSFELWNASKAENLCQNFHIKRHKKGEIVMDRGKEVDDVIFVKKGSVRLEKTMTF